MYRKLTLNLIVLLSLVAGADDRLLSHSTDFARVSPERWIAEGWRVENPDPGAMIVEVDGVLAFVVTEANRAMAWTLTTEPIWTEPFSTLAASYFIEGGVPADAPVPFTFFDGSTGPITPGATNAENPLASGGRYACGTFSAGLHVEAVDMPTVDVLERVGEITITVRSGDEPVVLRLNQLAFLASPVAIAETADAPWVAMGETAPDFTALSLPTEGQVTGTAMARHLGLRPEWWTPSDIEVGGVPFSLPPVGVATPLDGTGDIVIPGAGSGNTLALLLATRLWGSELAWYSKNNAPRREKASLAHQFAVTLAYDDGTSLEALPQRLNSNKFGLLSGVQVGTVPVDPTRTLVSATLRDGMSYGQVVLLAASRLDHRRAEESADTAVVETAQTSPMPEKVFIVEGTNIRLAIDAQGVVHSLQLGETRHEIVDTPFPLLTLLNPDGEAEPLILLETLQVPADDRLVLLWAVAGAQRQCELSLALREGGGLACAATLSNRGDAPWELTAVLPRLTGLRISRGGKPAYVLGGRSAIMDSKPIDTAEIYGGRYPNQFMDLYDETHGGGLAYLVLDDTLTRKWFEFKLDDSGRANMAVSYRRLTIASGERRALPPAVLMPHKGDWREPFLTYRSWVQQRFPRTRENSMADLFYCRRDYPLGGTSYLYDVAKPAYSFEKLIGESRTAFGGVDMVDISGWAYNESVGRVGTYRTNDLGGLPALAKGIRAAHAKKVQVGLYFEGYLLDKRAADASQGLAEWQLIREGNKPAWWSGEMEFFCCPGAPGWQDKLATDIAIVAKQTQADAVYVDQLGICDVSKECWAPNHGHEIPSNPIETEIALLQRIRMELDKVRPTCAIYIEHIPCDAMTPYIDGAFNLSMKQKSYPLGPTKIPLHRYLHPELPIFEMVAHGIRPIPAETDDLKLAFFHGMGLWLKGRGSSWYSADFRTLAADLYPIYTKFAPYFRSPDATPHINTLAPGVFANRFPHDGNTLYTLYNANPQTVSGALLELSTEDGLSITSLVESATLTLDIVDGRTVLSGTLPPEGIAGVVVMRSN